MESNNNHEEESTNSSTDQDGDLGVGRSYECVFCKRGFNTAQALGGHMNIHRKDRARNNKPNSNKPRFYHQIMPSSPAATQSRYATYFPEYSTSIPLYGSSNEYHHRQNDREASEEWRMSLSLEFPPPDLEKKRGLAMNQEKDLDLDLELRLGYH